jgi:hypothetical protein
LISRSCKPRAWSRGLVGALDPALGLRGHGVNEFDAQPLGDAAELGEAVAALRLLGVDAENPVPVRGEGQRQAVREHVRLKRLKISLGRLRRRELQMRQPPGRVIDEHDQRAARSPALEPVVRAPVDLNEFAEARPAFANLENLLGPPSLRSPEPQPNLDLADRLFRHPDALDRAELFARQRRAEIGGARLERRFDRGHTRPIEPVVRRPSAAARDHARLALAAIAANLPLHLPNPDAQKLRSPSLAQLAAHQPPQHIKPFSLQPAHRQNIPVQTNPPPLPQKGTSQLCSKGTFQLCCNKNRHSLDKRPNLLFPVCSRRVLACSSA